MLREGTHAGCGDSNGRWNCFLSGLSLVICELMFRAWNGVPVFELKNYRVDRPGALDISQSVRHDPDLGWSYKPNRTWHVGAAVYHMLSDGIIRTAESQTEPYVGGLLAVGSSFTAGSEVSDLRVLAISTRQANRSSRQQWSRRSATDSIRSCFEPNSWFRSWSPARSSSTFPLSLCSGPAIQA